MGLELPLDVASLKNLLFAIVLALPRVVGLIWVLPVIAMSDLPGMVRQVVALALCLPLLPMTHHLATTVDLVPFVWMLTLFKELAIGAFIGFGLGVFIWVFAHLGELVDSQAGYSNLYMFNNILDTSTGPFGTTATQAGIALFIALGGLRVAMETLLGSYIVWPIDQAVPRGKLLFEAFAITHMDTLFTLTVKLAAPAMLILLILEVGLGLVARFGKQIDISSISFAIKAFAGLMVIAVLLKFSVDIVGNVAGAATSLSRLLFGNGVPGAMLK
jgi:type III secretion protein T